MNAKSRGRMARRAEVAHSVSAPIRVYGMIAVVGLESLKKAEPCVLRSEDALIVQRKRQCRQSTN